MLHRKDFKQIAEFVSFIADPTDRKRIAVLLSTYLRTTNPRFDKDRFISARGVKIE